MLNWRQSTNNTKDELVLLQVDIVKDDPWPYAVFTEQGSSASQVTAAKIMDIISRYLIVMESLCTSANKESDDAYDVSTSLT